MRINIREIANSELLRCSIYFSAFCLVFYLYAYPLFALAANFYRGNGLTSAYAANMLGNACGYLAYSCLVRRGIKQKTIIFSSVFGLLFLFIVIFFIKSFPLFLVTVFVTAFLIGVLGALAHWSLAMLAYGSPVSGRLVGYAYAAALAVQFAVIHICRGNHAAALSLGLTISGAAALACPPPSNWLSRPAETDNKDRAYVPARSVFIVTIICVAILALVYGLYDGVISNLHAQQKLSVWDYPRLFSIAGVLSAAWIADIKKRSYLSAAVLCFLTAATAAVIFLRSPATYALSQSLQYFFSGAYVFFFTIVFMDIAPRSKDPSLWAGMGRTIYSAALIPLLFAGSALFVTFGDVPIICLTMAAFAAAIAALVARDRITAADFQKSEKANHLADFQSKYALTDREILIAKLLIEKDDTIDTIAADLDLSKRTCQRDITELYEKTGVQTRSGLLRAFYEE